MRKLTLSLTVSLILAPALLTAEYKKEPKVFAPCVTFVVTAIRKEKRRKIRVLLSVKKTESKEKNMKKKIGEPSAAFN